MGLSRNIVMPKDRVNIDLWQNCLAVQPSVVSVEPVLKDDGTSRKSVVDPKVIASGGGHLCPHELYVFISKTSKKMKITAGLTNHGGTLHVYFRDWPEKLDAIKVRTIFNNAVILLEARVAPPAVPPQNKLIEIPLPPTRPVPKPPTTKPDSTLPLVFNLTAEYNFDGSAFGKEYLSLKCGQKLRYLPLPEEGEGWEFGQLETGITGWFPPLFVSEEF